MSKTYSMDLRERLIAFVEAGHSRREAAARFSVSPSCAVKLLARYRSTGSASPARVGRPSGGGKLSDHVSFLVTEVEAQPDVTMPELARKLAAERGLTVHPASISRVLCQAGYTYKKNSDGLGMRTRGHP